VSIRRNLIAYLALFMALGGTSYAATKLARVQRSCDPKGSTTVAQDAVGRFYSITTNRRSGPLTRTYWYVCAFKQGASRRLRYVALPTRGPGRAIPWDSSAKVSGRYVAFFVFNASDLGSVKVIDMVTGHQSFSARADTDLDHANQLVLKANGSVGWIEYVPRQAGTIWYVRRHDSTGTATVDSGSAIDPKSLAAGGSWLYWTNAGSPRSAPFH
jgi:hypothetical protein